MIDWVINGDIITFTVTAQTDGWVGFGLARDAGSMLNSDAMIGYADSSSASVDDYDITVCFFLFFLFYFILFNFILFYYFFFNFIYYFVCLFFFNDY